MRPPSLRRPGLHRRLAAADLVIALVLGHGALIIVFHPRGRGDTVVLLPQRRFAAYIRIVLDYQLLNWYVGNDWPDAETRPTICGLPCRFPATSSIHDERRVQVYDITRCFGSGGAPKKFLP